MTWSLGFVSIVVGDNWLDLSLNILQKDNQAFYAIESNHGKLTLLWPKRQSHYLKYNIRTCFHNLLFFLNWAHGGHVKSEMDKYERDTTMIFHLWKIKRNHILPANIYRQVCHLYMRVWYIVYMLIQEQKDSF